MIWSDIHSLLDEPLLLEHLAVQLRAASRNELTHLIGAREFASFFAAAVRSLENNRPEWPLHKYLADPYSTALLIDLACRVANSPRFDRCPVSMRVRAAIGPLWAECLGRQAAGWHRPVAWDRRPALSTGASSLFGLTFPIPF